jgi:geranylgeranyl diphosphate synthase, type III
MSRDYVPLVNLLGLIFQVRDDFLNLQSDIYGKNKGFGEDLTEGKFSFPIIHSIRSNPSNIQLSSILKQRTGDVDVKRFAVSYIESTGSFEHCRRTLADLTAKAKALVNDVDDPTQASGSAVIDKILAMLGLDGNEVPK